MKKRNYYILFTAILIVFILTICGCGKKSAKPDNEPVTNQAMDTDTREGEIPTGETEFSRPSEQECIAITKDLVNTLNRTNQIGAGFIEVDDNTVYEDPDGYVYNLVLDPDIQNPLDLYAHLYDHYTASCINKHWSYLIEKQDGEPEFLTYVAGEDVPEGLYLIQGGKGYYDYSPVDSIQIEQSDDAHFNATVPFEDFGETEYLSLDILYEDGYWKINDFRVQ